MPTQKLHRDVYSSFIRSCQNLEATKMFSVGKWKSWVTSRQQNVI